MCAGVVRTSSKLSAEVWGFDIFFPLSKSGVGSGLSAVAVEAVVVTATGVHGFCSLHSVLSWRSTCAKVLPANAKARRIKKKVVFILKAGL
jgi:hypothetical protein